MKKLLAMVVAGGMLAFSASAASAVDIKVKGAFDFGFGLYDGTSFTKHADEEHFDANQRLRTQVDFIASESLKGVFQIEVGTTPWGKPGGATWGDPAVGRHVGFGMGGDSVSIEVKHMYLDWLVPNTDLQVRMGLQPFAMPTAVNRGDWGSGSPIFDDDMAGILLSYDFNENVGINLGWFRPWDADTGSSSHTGTNRAQGDEIDLFALTLPIEVADSFKFTPYAVFANVGDNVARPDELWVGGDIGYYGTLDSWLTGNGSFGADGRAWWAGFAFELSEFDPFIAALDFMYGSYSADDALPSLAYGQPFTEPDMSDPDRAGWAIIAKLGYKLDYFTPNIIGWYGSGADVDNNEGLDGLLPSLSPFWGMTSFGYVGSTGVGSRDAMIGASPAGTWGIALGLDDIRFVDNLTSHFRVAYYRGTNDVEEYNKDALLVGETDAFRAMKLLDKSDWAFEVNLDNTIQIYENLDMFVELAYMHVDVDQADSTFDENAYKGYVGFKYSF